MHGKRRRPVNKPLTKIERILADLKIVGGKVDPVIDLINNQADEIESLKAQLEAVRPYIQHRTTCRINDIFDESNDGCNCGLEQALQPTQEKAGD